MEVTMKEKILALDDGTAITILESMVNDLQENRHFEKELTPELKAALEKEFQVAVSAESYSKGEVARNALILLAQDKETREKITTLIAQPPTRAIGLISAVALTTLALVALQTHVRFERDNEGRTSIVIEKRPTDESILKLLVERVLSFVPCELFVTR